MNESVKKLNEFYEDTIKEGVSDFNFLRKLCKYISFIESDGFLNKIIPAMREKEVAESIGMMKGSLGLSLEDSFDLSNIEDETRDKYPLYEYKTLLSLYREFNVLGDAETEDEFKKKEVKLIEKNEFVQSTKTISGSGLLFMTSQCYKKLLPTLHGGLVQWLKTVQENGGISPKYFGFESKNSLLYVNGVAVKINQKNRVTNAHYLLEYLFNNDPFKKHFIDELNDSRIIDQYSSWKTYYRACEDIQKKVVSKTGLSNFMDFNTGDKMFVRVNPVYSSKND